ncbi:hypothetical protein D3C72_1114800 [compost metagenome]
MQGGAGHSGAHESGHSQCQQQGGELRQAGLGTGLQKRPEVGKRTEGACKGEHDAEHGHRHIGPLQQSQRLCHAAFASHRGQADGHPHQVQHHQRGQQPEHAPPADDATQITAERSGKGGRDGIAGVHETEGSGHRVGGHQPHEGGGGQSPESADHHPQQGPGQHQQRKVGAQCDQDEGEQHHQCQSHQHMAPLMVSTDPGDQQAGDDGEETRDGDGKARQAIAGTEIAGDRGQQADRHKLGGDQQGHAEGHGSHGPPMFLYHGEGVDSGMMSLHFTT